MRIRKSAVVPAAILFSAFAAPATTIVYTSPTAFEAAAGNLVETTFSTPYSQTLGSTYAQNGIAFDVSGGCANVTGGCLPPAELLMIPGSSGPQDTGGYAETSVFSETYGPAELNMTFTTPANAIGVFFGDASGYNGTGASVTLSDGTVYSFTATQSMFIGAISTGYLTSFDIVAPHDFGLATPEVLAGTPEPRTMSLITLGGMVVIVAAAWRR